MNIGSLIIRGFHNNSLQKIRKDLDNSSLGGVIFFKHNFIKDEQPIPRYSSYEETKNYLKLFSKKSLLSIDCEEKSVNRLNFLFDLKKTEELKNLSHQELVSYYDQKATLLKDLGFNLNFAPCVDKFYEQSFIAQRSFSSDIHQIIELASIYLEEFSKKNIYTCLKHFPGHGSASALSDSHKGIFYLNEYNTQELDPFLQLKAPFIMTAHVKTLLNPNEIATFSRDLIEKFLHNYEGIVITDDLHMGALVEYTLKERVIKSLQAGHDMLLFSQQEIASFGKCKEEYPDEFNENLHEQVIEIIEKGIQTGLLSQEKIAKKIAKVTYFKGQL